ncbi:lysM domain receptor-like kinase 3 [Olea europaea subsp. europaea]|uniref:LysM domain receptor-like kinase 3 n=1 Tax=Olea europaea subsp. europaea TaxID=158383 RepID=A0A8S0SFS7_OLEEU|nr:lysM domain receptor-like kinase 3 [Olea europaea subsp. europaea]
MIFLNQSTAYESSTTSRSFDSLQHVWFAESGCYSFPAEIPAGIGRLADNSSSFCDWQESSLQFGETERGFNFCWISRIQIASDIAHGLDYVHNSTGLGFEFVHNHMKSSNIIVTETTLNAEICHFGSAELCGETVRKTGMLKGPKRSDCRINKFEGTRGHMAPEFQRSGIVTQKFDVYAFGVVVLELSLGMEASRYGVDEETGAYVRIAVVETAREAVAGGGGDIRKWVDRRLKDSFPVEVVEKLAALALECVVDDPDSLPDMGRGARKWGEKMGEVTNLTVSLAPR